MRRIRILWLRFRSLAHKRSVDDELDDELRFHIESEIARRIASGVDAGEARVATLRSFGGLTQQKEACRDMRRVNFIEDFIRDVRYAGRMLRHSRSFAAVAILSLGLGIGANTAIFSLIDALLLRPLPVPHAERLVELSITPKEYGFSFSYPLFDYIRSHNQVFSGLFAWSNEIFQARLGKDVQNVRGVLASGDYFTALEVKPQLGRFFTAADDRSGGAPVTVISDRLWTAQFGRNPSAIGRPLTLDGMNFTIIGVMPPGFSGADIALHAEIAIPLSWEPRIYPHSCLGKDCWWLVVMGRLRPGVSMEEANAQLSVISRAAMETAIYPRMPAKERPQFLARKLVAQSGATGFSFLRYRFNNPLMVLMILVSLVLLIACANLASLLLARATARQREITVRLAIGAGRWRLIRQMLTESLLLSTAGGLLGALLASGLSKFLETFFSLGQEPILLNLAPDWRVLAFLFFVTVVTAVLFGIAPAIRATRVEIHAGLKEGSRTVQNSERRRPLTRLLLAGQVALSVLLVAGAGLFAGSLIQLRSLNRGFDPRGVVLFPLSADGRVGGQSEKGEALATLYQRLLKRLENLPGVEAASLMNIVPLGNGGWTAEISIPGRAELPETLRTVYLNKIAPHYFAMMHTPLLAGRDFNEHDTESSLHVAILNQRAAREYFPKGNAIGSQIIDNKDALTIVGIAANAKYENLRDEMPRTMYVPYLQNLNDLNSMTVGVRVKGDPSAMMTAIRPILRATIPGIPMPEPLKMTDQMNQSLAMERLMASLTLFFGLLALLLTSIGLYGTLAYAVTRRTAEIGIRMALGAERRCVIWLVLRENAALTVVGLVAGIAAVLVMSRLVSSLLYGITPHDPLALSLAVLILAAVAALASLLPALRASRIDPMTALRYE